MDRAPDVDSDTLSVDEIAELLAASRHAPRAPSRSPAAAAVDAAAPAEAVAPAAPAEAEADGDEDATLTPDQIAAMLGAGPSREATARSDHTPSPATPDEHTPDASRRAASADEALSAAEIAAMLAGPVVAAAEPADEALSAAEIAAMLAGPVVAAAEPADEALSAAEIAAMLAGPVAAAAEPADEALSAAEIAAMLAGPVAAAEPAADAQSVTEVVPTPAESRAVEAPTTGRPGVAALAAMLEAARGSSPPPDAVPPDSVLARGEASGDPTETIELDAVAAEEPAMPRAVRPPRPPPRSLPPLERASLPPAIPPLASLALEPLSTPPAARDATSHVIEPAAAPALAPPSAAPPVVGASAVVVAPTPASPAPPPPPPASPLSVVATPAPPRPEPPPAGSMDLEALISTTPHDLSRKLYRSDAIGRIVATLRMLGRDASGRPDGDRKFVAALLRAVTNDGLELPVMPKLVLDIQRVLDSPTADLGGVIGSIEQEPMVSTKVIGIASSAAYRAVAPPRSVREAVFRIGMAETRNVVLAILSHSKLFRVPGHEKRALELGRRAIGAAAAASRIARAARVDVDQAFLAGMTHDIGSVALLNVAAELHRSSRGKVVVTPRMLTEVEHAVHADLSALVAETWSFPPTLVAAFAHHHTPTEAPPEALRLTQLLALSDAIVLHLVDGRNHGIPTDHPAAVALGFRELRDLVGEVRRSFDSLCSAAAPPTSMGLRAGHAR